LSEREVVIQLRNRNATVLTVVLEPWGTRHPVEPGATVFVVARGPAGAGDLAVDHHADELVVSGWSESKVVVVAKPA
jgi:hypothetical protein